MASGAPRAGSACRLPFGDKYPLRISGFLMALLQVALVTYWIWGCAGRGENGRVFTGPWEWYWICLDDMIMMPASSSL